MTIEMAVERRVMMVVVLAGLVQSACGTRTYMVGDTNGWTFPPNGIATYFDDWAKHHAFYQGDSLLFVFQEGFHNVLEVSQADVLSCTTANPINTYTKTNATVKFTRTGYHGFICGEPSLCKGNIKINLNVLAVGTAAPPPPATPSTPSEANGPAASGPSSQNSAGVSLLRSASPSIMIVAAVFVCFATLLP